MAHWRFRHVSKTACYGLSKLFFITLLLFALSSYADFLESFETTPIGQMPPVGWGKYELAGGRGWSNSWSGRQPMPGWMSGTNTTPPTTDAGSRMAYVTYTHGGSKTNDLWLVSPELCGVVATSTVSFWWNSAFTNFADNLYAYISTNGPAVSEFTIEAFHKSLPRGYIQGVPNGDFGSWQFVTLDVGSLVPAGTDIHVGFREYHYNNWYDVRAIELDVIRSDLWGHPVVSTKVARVTAPTTVEVDYYIYAGSPAETFGVCWGPGPSPTKEDNQAACTNQGHHTCIISNVPTEMTLYFRTFATCPTGTIYGEELTLYPGDAQGEGYLFESFETTPIGQMPPAGWLKYEEAGGRGWSNSWAGRQPLPGWMSGTNTTPPTEGAGSRMAYVTYTHGGSKTNDLWLVSPQIKNIPTNYTLSFWWRSAFSNFADNLYAYISTKGNSVSDFTTEAFHQSLPRGYVQGVLSGNFGTWEHETIDVTSLVPPGSDIYVAFREYYWNNWYDVRAIELDVIELGNKVRNGLQFDGTDDRVILPLSNSVTAYTIEAWIKPLASGAANIMVANEGDPMTTYNQQLRITSGNVVEHYLYDGVVKTVTGTTVLQTGRWYHVAGTAQNNGTMRLYVNGMEEGTALSIGTITDQRDQVSVGAASGGGYSDFNGVMDALRFWTIARTSNQIQNTMNMYLRGMEDDLEACYRLDCSEGVDVFDSSDSSLYDALIGSPLDSYIWRKQAAYYDGADDYTTIPYTNKTANYTIEAWVFPTKTGKQNIMVFTEDDPLTSYQRQLRINASDQFEFYSYDGSTRLVTSTTTISPNRWYHIAGVAANGGVMRLYVNGTEENQVAAGNTMWGSCTQYMVAAASGDGFEWYEGYVHDVVLTNYAKSVAEILTTVTNLTAYPSNRTPVWVGTETPLGDYIAAENWHNRGVWQVHQSETNNTNGLQIATTTSGLTNFAVYGDNSLTDITSSDIPGGISAHRLRRVWYLDIHGHTNQLMDISFNPAECGAGDLYLSTYESGGNTYRLLRRDSSSGMFSDIKSQADTVSGGRIDFDAVSLTEGYYTFSLDAPPAPGILAATNISSVSFCANWSTEAVASNYYLDVGTDAGFSIFEDGYENRIVGSNVTMVVTGLAPSQVYYYRVRSENAGGISTNSASTSVKTLDEGAIGVSDAQLDFVTTYTIDPSSQVFTVTNQGEVAYVYTGSVAGAAAWLDIMPTNGTADVGAAIASTASVSVAGVNVGVYSVTNSLVSLTATNSPQEMVITLTVNKGIQTITFSPITDQMVTSTYGLAATSDSGLPVSFSVQSGPGALSSGTNLSFSATGVVLVVASQSGNTNWAVAADVTNSVTVIRGDQVMLSFTPATPQAYQSTNILSATGGTGAGVTNYLVLSGPGQIVGGDQLKITAGSGTVIVRATKEADSFYNARSATGSVMATRAAQTISFPNPGAQITTNQPGLQASASSDLSVSFSVGSGPGSITGGTNVTFTGAGSVSIVASQAGDSNWDAAPDVTNTVSVSKAMASVTLTNLNQVYDGTAQIVASETSPTGLTVDITYNGILSGTPTNAGTYSITGTVNDIMYQGSSMATLTVAKADQGITFPAITDQITTNLVQLAATSTSALQVAFSVLSGPASISGGTNLTFTTAGVVSIVASQSGDGNWNAAPDTTNSFNVTKAGSSITFTNLSQVYDGTPKSPITQTSPTGLTVNLTFDGSTNAPINTGIYAITGTVNDLIYQGTGVTTLTVMQADQTITFPPISDQDTTNAVGLVATADSGLTVIFAVSSGSASITGATNLTFSGEGAVSIVASQAGDSNWNAAADTTNSFTVNKAVATVAMTNLNQTYDQTARIVGSETIPGGLTVDITYDGTLNATPTNAGVYAITGTVNDIMYQGTSMATLMVAQANQLISFPTISDQDATNTVGLVATADSEFTVSFAVGSGPGIITSATNMTFTNSGPVSIIASQAGDSNWNAAADVTNSFNVAKAMATVTFTNLMQVYDRTPKSPATDTSPIGLTVDLTYNGLTNVPVNVGVYTVTGTVNEALYQGVNMATLTVVKADQGISFPPISDQLTTNLVSLAATSTSGLQVAFAVLSGPGVIIGGTNLTFTTEGAIHIVASQAGNTNWNAASNVTNTINVAKAMATVTLTNLSQVYDGTPKSPTSQTSPTGLTVNLTYDGSINAPVNVGSVSVAGVVSDLMYRGGVTNLFQITKAAQTIIFSNPGDQVWTNQLGLSASASSGLGVSFAVESGMASINGGTNLTFSGYGPVSIVASQIGNTNYFAAPNITNSFLALGPYMNVLGTNGQSIASGAAPTNTVGTEFPMALYGYPAQTNIFTITNVGNTTLSILSVTTNSSTTLAFRVVSYPIDIAVGAAAPCAIAFDTSAIGVYTANVAFAFNGTNTPFNVNLKGRVEPDIMSIYMPTQDVNGIERNVFSRYDWQVVQALTDLRDILNQTNLPGVITRFGGFVGYDPVFTNGNLSRLGNDLDYLLDVFPFPGPSAFSMTNNVGDKSFIDQYGNYFTTDVPWLFEELPYTNTYSVILEAGRHTAAAGILDILENVELVTRYNRIRILASDNTMTQTISFAAIPDPTYPDTVNLNAIAESGLPGSFTNVGGSPVVWQSATSVTFTATGDVYIVASQTGSVNYLSAPEVTNRFTVQKGYQTISFPNPGDQITTNSVGLAATASNSLGVSFAVSSGPGIISGGTNLSFTAEGSVNIVASQSGNAYWHAAPDITNTINVTKALSSVTLNNLSQIYDGTPKNPTSQTSPTGLAVTLTYSITSTPVNVGYYTVIGTVDDMMYRGGTTNTLEITKASQTIIFPNPGTQIMTNTVGLAAIGGGSGNTVMFSLLSGPAVLTGGTNLTFNNSGIVILTADQAANSNYLAAVTVTNSFTITPAIPVVAGPTVSNIFAHIAMLGGLVTTTNGGSILERGVYVSVTNGFDPQTGKKFSESGSFGEVAYSVSGSNLTAGSINYFLAFARNSAGEGYSSHFSFLTRPDAPAALAETNVMLGQFNANWATAVGATNYFLDVSTTNTFTSYVGVYSNLNVGNVTTYPVTGLGTLPSYFYRLRAENETGISTNSNTRKAFMMMTFTVKANPTQHDSPLPYGYSTNYILYGTIITNSVASPADESNETRYVCSGWTGHGAVPARGTNLSFVCAVTAASEVVWRWQTEHYLDLTVNNGTITGAVDGWKYEGWIYDLMAIPKSGYLFNYWNVDGYNLGNSQLLTITSDSPHDVTAVINSAAWDLSRTGTAFLASWRVEGKWFYIHVNLCNPSDSGVEYITKFVFALPHPTWTYNPAPGGMNPMGEVYWDRTAQVISELGRDYLLPGECVTIGELGIFNPPVFAFDGRFYSKGEPMMPASHDTDHDGMPNIYEDGEGLEKNDPIDAHEDQDSDTMTAIEEYIADTDPFDGNSYLGLTSISNDVNGCVVNWIGGTWSIQYLDWAPSVDGPWFCILTNNPPTQIDNHFNHDISPYNSGIYRIRAIK